VGIGAILVVIGLIVWLAADSLWLGLIIIVVGLLVGGFRRGSWY
jgi:hypothetical protein